MPRFPQAYLLIRVGASLLHKYDLSWAVALGRRLGLKTLLLNSSSKVEGEPITPETIRWLRSQYAEDVTLTEELVGGRLREIWGFGEESA